MTNFDKENLENVNPVTQNEGADKVEKSGSFGKFKSKDDLIKAYDSLEAEFTRKSQRLKELESSTKQQEDGSKWAKKVEAFNAKYPVAKSLTNEITSFLEGQKELLKEEDCLEKALLNVLARQKDEKEQSYEMITKEIYNGEGEGYSAPTGGEIPFNPPKRPKTIREAGEQALNYFSKIKF